MMDPRIDGSPNACFISYRHTHNEEAHRYVQAFVSQLKKCLSFEIPSVPVFFDEEGIQVGTVFHSKLAWQLQRSACLVVFFSPQYFDLDHPYCALEYRAMLELEKERQDQYGDRIGEMSMIFPVVFRGRTSLPAELEARTPLDLTSIRLEEEFKEDREIQKKLGGLAEEIASRYRKLTRAGVFRGHAGPEEFVLPPLEAIAGWIEGLQGGQPAAVLQDIPPPRELPPDPQRKLRERTREALHDRDVPGAVSAARELLATVPSGDLGPTALKAVLEVADELLSSNPEEGLDLLRRAGAHAGSVSTDGGDALRSIADLCRRHRRDPEALEYSSAAEDRYRRILGPTHALTLAALEQVANDKVLVGDQDGAMAQRERLVEARRALARSLVEQGDERRAREQLEQAFELCRDGLGERARLTALVATELAASASQSPAQP